jgi:hypothetical protein
MAQRQKRRALAEKVVLPFAALLVMTAALPIGANASSDVPTGLSHDQRMAALAAMSPQDRAHLRDRFTNDRYVVTGYARTIQSFEIATGKPVGAPVSLGLAETAPAAPAGIANLALTISLTYDRDRPCCYWDIFDTFRWSTRPPNGNAGKDQIVSAWNNNMALYSPGGICSCGAWGTYANGSHISFNLQDVTPGAGFNYEFDECWTTYNACFIEYANYGYEIGTLWETSRHNQATNLVFKYYHTYADVQYDVSISGAGPSISISPTSNQTNTALSLSFTN